MHQQWLLMKKNSWLMALLTWVPIVSFFILWWIFSAGLATKLPIAVVDLDHSQMSRSLIGYYDANPTLSVQSIESEAQARALMRKADVYALVIIPNSLEKDTQLGLAPIVSAYYNAQFMVAGKLISSALQKSQVLLQSGEAIKHSNKASNNTPSDPRIGQPR